MNRQILLAGLICVIAILILSASAQTNEIDRFGQCEHSRSWRSARDRFSSSAPNHFYRTDSEQAEFTERNKLQERSSRPVNNSSQRNLKCPRANLLESQTFD